MLWWDRCMLRFWFVGFWAKHAEMGILGQPEAVPARQFLPICLFFGLFRGGLDQKVTFSSFFHFNPVFYFWFSVLGQKKSTFHTFVSTTSTLRTNPKSFWNNFTFVEHLLPWCSPNFLKQKLDNFFFILLLWFFFLSWLSSVFTKKMLLLSFGETQAQTFSKKFVF